MINLIHIKNDLKQVFRDPIMSILMLAPLLIIIIFKLLIVFLFPFIATKFNFDISLYNQYLMAGILIMISGMLGIVIGFMMLDDKDVHPSYDLGVWVKTPYFATAMDDMFDTVWNLK